MKGPLLLQLDGKLPNIALMRIAEHYHSRGEAVRFRNVSSPLMLPELVASTTSARATIYASTIFERTRPIASHLLDLAPGAIVGGTGWRIDSSLEAIGITTPKQDYSIYPDYLDSIGFTQRGCRLKCKFCCVPQKEGNVQQIATIPEIWRGDPYPRHLLLLDNDFFGQSEWRARIKEMQDGNFKVSFNQGINARMLTDEAAEAIASVRYYDNDFSRRMIYTAWDNRGDEERLFTGLRALVRYGVKPDHIMVYMLCGYWPGETHEDREYRRKKLREFGARPYPMPYVRSKELIGFQRWVVRRLDINVPWDVFQAANYRPEKLNLL